jgi:CRP-like cAMP-binding protein
MDANELSNSSCDGSLAFPVDRKATLLNHVGLRPRNRLLATLPRRVISSLRPHLMPVLLPPDTVLCDADEPLTHVYFIETGLVSLVSAFENGTTAEMATVGREGLVGIDTLLGSERALGRYLVPVPGVALAIETVRFHSALQASPDLRALSENYAQAFLREALQTAACNSVHMVEERCARRLLMSHDRSDDQALTLTQEYLAETLGVCRSTVTLAASGLRRAGLIGYRRGTIRVLDRAGLERVSCECYRVIRSQYERLLPRSGERPLSLVDQPSLSLVQQPSRSVASQPVSLVDELAEARMDQQPRSRVFG